MYRVQFGHIAGFCWQVIYMYCLLGLRVCQRLLILRLLKRKRFQTESPNYVKA